MKDKYEISLWEDYLVQETTIGSEIVPAHYEERKLAIIGSNTMTSDCRAYEPYLVENVNGTNTFTFRMHYVYNEDGESIKNPFLNLLVNERKVKLFWKDKWYDLIIKNCQEDSNKKSITYTCTDLFINELSKTGFDIEFDTELENNTGTVLELAQTVLEDTDWQLDESGSDIIQQKKEEPLYEVLTLRSFSAQNETTGNNITIEANKKIYIFYTSFFNKDLYCQFLYDSNQLYPRDTNSQRIIDVDCCSVQLTSWNENTSADVPYWEAKINSNAIFRIASAALVSDYRGTKLVRSQKTTIDPLTGEYVKIYRATATTADYDLNDEIYEFESAEFKDPTFVNNIIVNSKDFANVDGWLNGNLIFELYPSYKEIDDLENYTANSYLHLTSEYTYNSGLRDMGTYLKDGFIKDEKYIFRYQGKNSLTENSIKLKFLVCEYEDQNIQGVIYRLPKENGKSYFTSGTGSIVGEWTEYTLTCSQTITASELFSEKVGLFIQILSGDDYYLKEAQFFPYVVGADSDNEPIRINPNDMNIHSVYKIYYKYYNHTKQSGVVDIKDLKYFYSGETPYTGSIVAQYNDNFEKIRSITAKNSNRFNLLQELAETFECWCRFNIEHDSTGKIVYNNGIPQKYISFVNEIGQETGIGFIYGIDLKSTSRTIQSDQIVTKTIVSSNNNEFAKNGMCTIQRSSENYPRDNFILNFDYYISQGLLDGGELNKDLYLSTSDAIGYYFHLNQINTEYDSISEWIIEKTKELDNQKTYAKFYETYINSAIKDSQRLQSDIFKLSGASNWDDANTYIQANQDFAEVKNALVAWQNNRDNLEIYQSALEKLEESIEFLEEDLETKKERSKELLNSKKQLDYKFYKKYSRFIQEGSWTSEDYVDDNLYYFDAQSVAYTSSRPQISYNISVFRISSIEEFKNKVFRLGDISFIQDTEFFGYLEDGKTPYKEKVLVSEIESYLDEPQKDTFKIQNYKTQFEDLFQRITSTTQSLQYASGEYARAASVIEQDGTISTKTLQNSIINNNQLVFSARNESVVQDSTGITVSDLTNINNKLKITSTGLFISTDGGQEWRNAISGDGLSTEYLASGSINTNTINIVDGNFSSFRWDVNGINAYSRSASSEEGKLGPINTASFVRFDRFGLYGIDGDSTFVPESASDIKDNAIFGLLWDGFFLKKTDSGDKIEISTENDFLITHNNIQKIKIGKLDNEYYGIRFKNNNGNTTLETDDSGYLWLRDKLSIANTINIGDLDPNGSYKSTTRQFINCTDTENSNNKFIVYQDGSIYATSGKIGNMNISDLDGEMYRSEILSNNGTIFKNGVGTKTLTAYLYKGDTEITNVTYQWYKDGTILPGETDQELIVSAPADTNSIVVYSCEITLDD